jgi:Fe-S-cluster-containing dehydrogenase component
MEQTGGMMKTILVDAERCIRCGNCTTSCHDEHFDNDWRPIAAAQGTGSAWIKIDEHDVSSGARVKTVRTPLLCLHCGNAACVAVCKAGAIFRREDGIVLIDPDKCTGCQDCIAACAYGSISFNVEDSICQKCTLCAHLLDADWQQPRCVTACPSDALAFVDTADLTEENLTAPLELLLSRSEDDPLVKYINLPKPFVGGDVVSDRDKNPLRRVRVVATHQVSGWQAEGYTDAFGGFNITRLKPGQYTLTFELDGFDVKEIRNIDLRQARNIKTVALHAF